MPIRIGVRLAKVGPPPPPSSACAAAAAAAASEEAPARCSKVRRIMSGFIVGGLPGLGELTAVYHNFETAAAGPAARFDHMFVGWRAHGQFSDPPQRVINPALELPI